MTTKTEESPTPAANPRAESFKEEVRNLNIKDPNASRDRLYLGAGLVAMGAGVIIAIIGYFMSHNTNSLLEQNDAQVIAMIGIALTVAGGAVFLRYSFAGFMRFWLARFLFEQRNRD